MTRALRIVMMTQRSKRADAILVELARRRVPVRAVILDRGSLSARDKLRRTRQVLRRSGPSETARRVARGARRGLRSRAAYARKRERLVSSALSQDVHVVGDVNSDRGVGLLTELDPDLVVLGSSRILRPEVIGIPRLGVLNAHPGLLPDYRGVDVIPWAVDTGGSLGVTVHYVDTGIDTGEVVAQRRLELLPGDTLASLERRADQLAGELMGEVVEQLVAGERLAGFRPDPSTGHLYSRMAPAQRRHVDAELQARWR